MKKIIGILGFVTVMAVGASAYAAVSDFNVSLSVGSTNKVEVLKLQQFLFDNNYLKVSPTGAYLSLTQKAVADFQKANGITPASGYFGPLTRAAANAKLAATTGTPNVAVSAVTGSNTAVATVLLSNGKSVTWTTNNYPEGVGVNIHLLRKSTSGPVSFSVIRTVAQDTPNDGNETFSLQTSELGGDVYVEVTCSSTYQFKSGCHFSDAAVKVN